MQAQRNSRGVDLPVFNLSTCPFLSQVSAVHVNPSCSLEIFIYSNMLLPSVPKSSKRFLTFTFPHQKCVRFSLFPLRATCPAQIVLVDLTKLKIFVELLTYLNFSLCYFLLMLVSLYAVSSLCLLLIMQLPPYASFSLCYLLIILVPLYAVSS